MHQVEKEKRDRSGEIWKEDEMAAFKDRIAKKCVISAGSVISAILSLASARGTCGAILVPLTNHCPCCLSLLVLHPDELYCNAPLT